MNLKHGMSHTPEYNAWAQMWYRCTNKNAKRFPLYESRVPVLRWKDFTNFFADMGPRPSPKHTLERVDNNKRYSPKNCVWATQRAQAHNRTTNTVITHKGKTMVMSAWAAHLGIGRETLRWRLKRWSVDSALTQPVSPRRFHG